MYLYRSTGQYIGFIQGDNLFDRDGKFLGWKIGPNVWSTSGQYKGQLKQIDGDRWQVVRYLFSVSPLPQIPRANPPLPILPNPTPSNIQPFSLQAGFIDAI